MAAGKTRILNAGSETFTLPPPYSGIIPPGGIAITGDDKATTVANLGGALALKNSRLKVSVGVANDIITAPSTGLILSASLVIPSAQVKTLKGTPLVIVPAQGAGRVLVPVECAVYLKYGGTNAFTANAGENLAIGPVGGNPLLLGASQAMLQSTNSAMARMVADNAASTSVSNTKTLSDNVALQIANIGAAEIAGNAAGDNSLIAVVNYRADAPGW